MTGLAFLPSTMQLVVPPELAGQDLLVGYKTVNPDLTAGYDPSFVWPLPGGHVTAQVFDTSSRSCGHGLHIAKTIRGATSYGYRRTILLVAYSADEAVDSADKVRVPRCWVLAIGDLHSMFGPGADLGGADLRVADLRVADLRGADLRVADLRGADLWGADLWGADLRGADLRGADLRVADLRAADLRAADLRDADLRAAKGNTYTILPDGWKVDEQSWLIVRTSETDGGS